MMDHNGATDTQQVLVSSFFLGEAAFGIDTSLVQEVVRVGDTTPVHHAPPFVLGVMNLRGRIATVIDLGVKLELDRAEPSTDNRIFIVDWQGEPIGLLVDRIADAVILDTAALQPPPENVRGIQGRQFKGVFQLDGRLVALLDMAAVLAVDDTMDAGSSRRG
jgi:purine-binding chemotaxis protein CheW